MANPGWAFGMRGEASSDVLEIDIYDDIGDYWWGDSVSAKDVRAALKNSKATTIKLRVNSRGGDVIDGLAIYNMLAEHPARVEAQVDALAASMASIVIMAADEIRVAANALIMIHNPWAFVGGEAEDLRSTADLLDKMRDKCADIYVARTGIAKDRVLAMMADETWLSAEEAKAEKFADVITPNKKGAAQSKMLAALKLDGLAKPPAQLLAAIAKARGAAPEIDTKGSAPAEESSMDKAQRAALCVALGLSPDVSDDVIVQGAKGLTEKMAGLVPKGDLEAANERAAKAEAEIAKARSEARAATVAALIDEAVKAGKVAPASREHYAALCGTDAGLETVKALFGSLASLGLDRPQGPSGAPPAANGKQKELTAEQRAHCKKHGLNEAIYLETINEER